MVPSRTRRSSPSWLDMHLFRPSQVWATTTASMRKTVSTLWWNEISSLPSMVSHSMCFGQTFITLRTSSTSNSTTRLGQFTKWRHWMLRWLSPSADLWWSTTLILGHRMTILCIPKVWHCRMATKLPVILKTFSSAILQLLTCSMPTAGLVFPLGSTT